LEEFEMKRGHRGRLPLWCVALLTVSAVLFDTSSPSADRQDQLLPLKIKVGEMAPDFSLPSADGKTVKLSDYAGHNVLMDFYRGYW
jgi:cytochrome oxidase Cu insertion factor (SCO1/SenC/PrrC family)